MIYTIYRERLPSNIPLSKFWDSELGTGGVWFCERTQNVSLCSLDISAKPEVRHTSPCHCGGVQYHIRLDEYFHFPYTCAGSSQPIRNSCKMVLLVDSKVTGLEAVIEKCLWAIAHSDKNNVGYYL